METGEDPFGRLVGIMHRLRAPGGCPWDAEQTHSSLRPYLLEEAYEVLEALDSGDDLEFCDELGDLLLQVLFHAELAAERDAFKIADVIAAVSEKLIRRHPHVFGDAKASDSRAVVVNWARIKREERAQRGAGSKDERPSLLAGVPRALPALLRAHRLGEKAAEVGFDWPSAEAAREKISEELGEVDQAIADGDLEAVGAELGDLLFAVVSYTRLGGMNAETLLETTLVRFRKRFESMEKDLAARGMDILEASPEARNNAWERVKRRC